jgi:cobalt-zinc-cadmium efflux system outer membrane protein
MTRAIGMAERGGLGALLLLLGLAGCASVDLAAGFPEVKATVEERAAARIAWTRGLELDREGVERLDALLQRRLTADDAVAIALLGNRDLQAMYSDLGVAHADSRRRRSW